MDTKDHVIAKLDTDDGHEIFWQGSRWWGRSLKDAQGFSEEEANEHKRLFDQAGVHKVYVVNRAERK